MSDLIKISHFLYRGRLMQLAMEACMFNNCNNPVPYADIPDSAKIKVSSYLSSQHADLASQLFIEAVGADNYSKNGMNYEPSWIYALQQLKPHELALAKRKYIRVYLTNPENYQLFEEGGGPVGP